MTPPPSKQNIFDTLVHYLLLFPKCIPLFDADHLIFVDIDTLTNKLGGFGIHSYLQNITKKKNSQRKQFTNSSRLE